MRQTTRINDWPAKCAAALSHTRWTQTESHGQIFKFGFRSSLTLLNSNFETWPRSLNSDGAVRLDCVVVTVSINPQPRVRPKLFTSLEWDADEESCDTVYAGVGPSAWMDSTHGTDCKTHKYHFVVAEPVKGICCILADSRRVRERTDRDL